MTEEVGRGGRVNLDEQNNSGRIGRKKVGPDMYCEVTESNSMTAYQLVKDQTSEMQSDLFNHINKPM